MSLELIVLIVSSIFIVVGVTLWLRGNHLLKNGKKADAIIFENNFNSTSSDGGMYYPVVRFVTEKKEWITQELRIGYFPAKPEGTKLEVIYDKDNPTNVEINSRTQLEILPRIFVSIGITGIIFLILEYLNITGLIS